MQLLMYFVEIYFTNTNTNICWFHVVDKYKYECKFVKKTKKTDKHKYKCIGVDKKRGNNNTNMNILTSICKYKYNCSNMVDFTASLKLLT